MGSAKSSAVATQSLFPEPRGRTFDRARDGQRLGEQYARVLSVMSDGRWRTLAELSEAAAAPEASVSARLRDARRAGLTVERRHVRAGLHAYRMPGTESPIKPPRTARAPGCPHCGGTATREVAIESPCGSRRRDWHTRCLTCGAMGPAVESAALATDPRERAREAWRRRVKR